MGVYKRPGEALTWQGALHSLQVQADNAVHVGALTAVSSEGSAHYLRLGREPVFLFSKAGVGLPAWFEAQDWTDDVRLIQTGFLPPDLGVRSALVGGYALKASSPERAILESLHLAPQAVDLMEVYQVLEGLRTLRPTLVQSLLDACNSVKVKRLFLFMAEKANLPVLSHLEIKDLDLGSGDRGLVKGGVYVPRHRLVLPAELVA